MLQAETVKLLVPTMAYYRSTRGLSLLLSRKIILNETVSLSPDHVFKQHQTTNTLYHYLKHMLHCNRTKEQQCTTLFEPHTNRLTNNQMQEISLITQYFDLYPTTILGPGNVVCFLHLLHTFKCTSLDFYIEANNMNPDPKGAIWSESILFEI